MKAHQLIALADARGPKLQEALQTAAGLFGSEGKFTGHMRSYVPFKSDDPAEQLPPERKLVQANVHSVLGPVLEAMASILNTVSAQDTANTLAHADLIVEGKVLIPNVPVTTLMFMMKKLIELKTVITKIPVLDPSEVWTYDATTGSFRSESSQSFKMKKVFRNHVKADATDRHPAQVDVYSEDAPIGTWTAVKLSGAIPATVRAEVYARVSKVLEAVKIARDKANEVNASIDDAFAKPVLDYVFGPLSK